MFGGQDLLFMSQERSGLILLPSRQYSISVSLKVSYLDPDVLRCRRRRASRPPPKPVALGPGQPGSRTQAGGAEGLGRPLTRKQAWTDANLKDPRETHWHPGQRCSGPGSGDILSLRLVLCHSAATCSLSSGYHCQPEPASAKLQAAVSESLADPCSKQMTNLRVLLKRSYDRAQWQNPCDKKRLLSLLATRDTKLFRKV